MTRPVIGLPVSHTGPDELLPPLLAALDGTGPALDFGDDEPPAVVPDPVALIVATSGSSGRPRRVLLDGAALTASAKATEERLGGPAQWLLTLPATHIAGLQVLVRSLVSGTHPVLGAPGPFRAKAFTADVGRMDPGQRRYVSLVPTQLHRILDDPTPVGRAALDALVTFDAILVGGAALNPDLARRASAAGLAIRTTYGMTETCGGCVYDAVPLAGVRVRTDDAGHILLAGPVLARGYHEDAAANAAAFVETDGVRWFRTNDLGTVHPITHDGSTSCRVEVTGRADDVIITGGVNVPIAPVEAALAGWAGLGEVCVVGLPNPEWGQALVVVITAGSGDALPTLAEVRARVSDVVGPAAAPRAVHVLDALPARGPGKIDRVEVTRLIATRTGEQTS